MNNASGEIEQLLTKAQVAEILGVKESWLNTEIQAGRIPYRRLGSKKFVRFTRTDVERYIDSKSAEPSSSRGSE
jgi:excisionase family DNA binding protein